MLVAGLGVRAATSAVRVAALHPVLDTARSQAQQQGGSPTVRLEGSGLPGVYYKMLGFPSVTASVTKPLFKEQNRLFSII